MTIVYIMAIIVSFLFMALMFLGVPYAMYWLLSHLLVAMGVSADFSEVVGLLVALIAFLVVVESAVGKE